MLGNECRIASHHATTARHSHTTPTPTLSSPVVIGNRAVAVGKRLCRPAATEPNPPLIFSWALDWLDRLNERGYFLNPASGKEAIQQLEDLSSPISAFIRDERCGQRPSPPLTTA